MGIIMKNENISTFETTDFQLSAFLLAKGFILIGFRQTVIPGRKLFVFHPANNLQKIVQNFWEKKELIEPIQLLTAERELKNRLYNQTQKFTKDEE